MSTRGQRAWLFFIVLLGHSYFVGATSWNQNSRLGAIFTFVEPGPNQFTFRIDEFERPNARWIDTQDWAFGADDYLYPNKAPGVSMLGVPFYAAIYAVETAAGADVRTHSLTRTNAILINAWTSTMWTAAATVVLFMFLRGRGWTTSDALVPALGFAFATLVFPYDISIWGHSTAAAAILICACLVFWPGGPRLLTTAGAIGGLAVLVEYPSVFALGAIGLALMWRRTPWRAIASFAFGAAIPLVALVVYQKLVFGGFFTAAVVHGNPEFLSGGQTLGVLSTVRPEVVWRLLGSPYRGLFLYCPVLLFSVAGAWHLWRTQERALVLTCVGGAAATVLFISTFNGWWGGQCAGPRYLIVMMPLLCLLLPRLSAMPTPGRALYGLTLSLSALNMLAISAVEVMTPADDQNPLYGFVYTRLFSGRYPAATLSGNFGADVLGLRAPFDVILFSLCLALGVYALLRRARSA